MKTEIANPSHGGHPDGDPSHPGHPVNYDFYDFRGK